MKHLGKSSLSTVLILLMWFENNNVNAGADDMEHGRRPEDEPHSRQKRLLWITTDGRLALPPGTRLTITPSLSLPFVRYPPDGFLSNMSISLPFTSEFREYRLPPGTVLSTHDRPRRNPSDFIHLVRLHNVSLNPVCHP